MTILKREKLIEKRRLGSFKMKKHMIVSEEIFIPEENTEITSMVGSSVAVTLYDRKRGVGGVLHFLLPKWSGVGIKSCKYGDIGTEELIEKMLANGSERENLIANIVGGAIVGEFGDDLPTGLKNVKSAKKVLGDFEIAIDTVDVGKELGRYISFNSETGVINIKYNSSK
jgi:chemotaxis protein CheD